MQHNHDRIDFKLANESSIWWLAPKDLGGYLLPEFITSIYEGVNFSVYNKLPLASVLERGGCIPIPLYSDGPDMYIRLVLGELNPQEEAEWVARISWKLDLTGGQLLIAEGCDPSISTDFESIIYDPAYCVALEETLTKAPSESLCCWATVPPNHYCVNIYSYLPYDWSSWESIHQTGIATSHPEAEPLADFFSRTRPNESKPVWIDKGYSELDERKLDLYYISFVIQLTPLQEERLFPKLNEGGFVEWERRKPQQCPLGIIRTSV